MVFAYVDDACERITNRPMTDGDHEQSVLEKLLKVNRTYAVSMAMDMIIAGVDTVMKLTKISLSCNVAIYLILCLFCLIS